MNLEQLKSEKEKVKKEIKQVEKYCREEVRDGAKWTRYDILVTKLSALNLGMQAVENTIKDEIEFLKYIHLENATEEDIVKRLTQLQKQKEDMK